MENGPRDDLSLLDEMILGSQNPENVPPPPPSPPDSVSEQFQNSVEIGPTTFEDLPNEVIGQFFSFLDRDDCQRIRAVNRNFSTLIDSIFGIKILLANDDYEDLITSLNAQNKKVTWVMFMNLTMPIETPPVKFLENVSTLEFHWITIGYNLLPILLNCPKLTHLKFLNAVIDIPLSYDKYDPVLAQGPWNLSKLKSFTIQTRSHTETAQNIMRQSHLIERGIFGSIEKIIFIYEDTTPLLPIQEIFNLDTPGNDPLMHFTWLQRKTLKLFEVRVNINNDLNESSSLKFEFYPYGSKDEDICPLQIKHGVFNQPIRPQWNHFLIWQGYLKSLQFEQFQVRNWSLIRSIIKRSEGTLEKVIVDGQAFGHSWDCCLFIEKLTELRLDIHFAQKIGLLFLPFSLTTLKIVAPIIKTEMTRILSLVNLRSLIFENLSNGRNRYPLREDSDQDDESSIIDLKLFLNYLLLPKLEYFGLENIFRPFYNYDPLLKWCQKYPQGLKFTENSQLYQYQIILNGLSIKICPGFDRNFVREYSIHGEGSQTSCCTSILQCL